jgi:hypothetical protein
MLVDRMLLATQLQCDDNMIHVDITLNVIYTMHCFRKLKHLSAQECKPTLV